MEKTKKVNEFIVEKATEKVVKSMEVKEWDEESFNTMCKALDNLKDIMKIEYKDYEKKEVEEKESKLMAKVDAKTNTTEFEQLIYDIAKKRTGKEGMLAITTIIADHMEDMRVLNNRAYCMVMMKLKELLY